MDTGPIVALLQPHDDHHLACVELLGSYPGPLVVPALCVAEVAQLVTVEAEVRLLIAIAGGELSVERFHPADAERTAELVAQYRDLPLGTVDASVVAAAERLEVTQIATLDRRHFSVLRPRHTEAFELLP